MGASVLIGALELGLLYAIMGFGVYLSFRVLNIPDLTIDGSFTCGCAAAAMCTLAAHPYLGLAAAFLCGMCCGPCCQDLLSKKVNESKKMTFYYKKGSRKEDCGGWNCPSRLSGKAFAIKV